MISAVNFVDSWLPNLVEPGSVLVITNTGDGNSGAESFCALLHCPFCACLVVVTEPQCRGKAAMTCGVRNCPASLLVRDGLPASLVLKN